MKSRFIGVFGLAVAAALVAGCTNSSSTTATTSTTTGTTAAAPGSASAVSRTTATTPAAGTPTSGSATATGSASSAPQPSADTPVYLASPGSTAPITNGIPAPVTPTAATGAPVTKGFFRLQTQLSVAFSQCLEANASATGAYLSGASFMDECQNVTGEYWKATPAAKSGYYLLQTMRTDQQKQCLQSAAPSDTDSGTRMQTCSGGANQNWRFVDAGQGTFRLQTEAAVASRQCLEGNQVSRFALVNGASFLTGCKAETGQVWTVTPASAAAGVKDRNLSAPSAAKSTVLTDLASSYRLQTKINSAKCLEGNQVSAGAALKGAAFLEDCKNVTGQLWTFVETDQQGVYQLQTKQSAATFQCFDGNELTAGADLDGAAHMAACANDDGQRWMLVQVSSGVYRMQTVELAGQNSCLEGNRVDAASFLAGAAFMDTCQNVTGQLWTITAVKQ